MPERNVDAEVCTRSMSIMHEILESRVGKYCIIAYSIFALVTYVLSLSCGADACRLSFIAPIMPWGYLLTEEFGMKFPFVLYPVLMLLNVSLVYIVGAGAEYVWHRLRDKRLGLPAFLRHPRT